MKKIPIQFRKVPKIFPIILMAIFICFLSSLARATTYYVCPSSSSCPGSVTPSDSNNGTSTATPWATMTKVTTVYEAGGITAGSVVNLGGTYNAQTLTLPTYSGSSGNIIVFQQWAAAPTWTDNGNNAISVCVNIQGTQYITVSGINCFNTQTDGLIINNGSNDTFTNFVSNDNVNSTDGYDDQGVLVTCSSACSNDSVTNGTANSNGGAGIEGYGTSSAYVSNLTVTGNMAQYNGAVCTGEGGAPGDEGIDFFGVAGGTISGNNTAYNTRCSGGSEGQGVEVDLYSTNISVTDNFIFNNAGSGVVNLGGSGNNFEYNLIYGNTFDCFDGDGTSSNSNLYNNTCVGSVNGFVINESGSTGINIKNNIISGMSTYGIYIVNGGTLASEDYNDVYNSGSSNFKNISQGTHDITANPGFINSAANNYQLLSTSPAITAGTNVSLTTDILGNPVPNPPSIGAYQFISSSSSGGASQWNGTFKGTLN